MSKPTHAIVVYNDGGRAKAGYKGNAGDCGARAVAIALEIPYQQAYDELGAIARQRKCKRQRKKKNARSGIYRNQMHKMMTLHGWSYIEFECGELPPISEFAKTAPSRCVVLTKGHYFALVNGERHDTHGIERTGTVIGYYSKSTEQGN